MTENKIQELEAELKHWRQALAESEAQLAELKADTEPTADYALELKRVQEVQNRRQALERVIVAQQRKILEAGEALQAERQKVYGAQLAEIRAEADGIVAACAAQLWDIYHATDALPGLRDKSGLLRQKIGDASFGLHDQPIADLQALREGMMRLLPQLRQADIANGEGGLRLTKLPTPEARAEQQAQEANVRQLQKMRRQVQQRLQREQV